jgi:hypothetical protein
MAEFQRLDGTRLPPTIIGVVGSSIELKFVPGRGEKIPIPVNTTAPAFAQIQAVNQRVRPNFATFRVSFLAPGDAKLFAGKDPSRPLGGPIGIRIEWKASLPDAHTDAGVLVRLFLAETPTPDMPGYNDADAEESMSLMRAVIGNRLAKPSHLYASAGARTMVDVVRARGQFEGFDAYPAIRPAISNRLDQIVAIVNDGGDGRRTRYKKFLDTALKIASLPSAADPALSNLYFWRTAGSGSPAPQAKVYRTISDNTFYSL